MTERVDLVGRSLSAATREAFESRVDDQAAFLRDVLARGDLDTADFAVGMELEVYAVDSEGRLARLPDPVFETCNPELGLHNAELNTDPDRLTTEGIEAQAAALREQWARAQEAAAAVDRELVLDAMWTVPPAEGSREYLGTTDERDGVAVPANMRPVPRYWAIDRDVVDRAGGAIPFEVPGASLSFPSILFESLATSIQPHVQIPSTDAFPAYYAAAIRTLGPLLALTANSPFLPADCYDEAVDPEALLAETHHELRIAAFEQSVNQTDPPKVRVPSDIDETADVIDEVVADPLLAPFLSEWIEGGDESEAFADRFWEFDHKRGTYWRWLRAVIGGDPVPGAGDERSIRIEYRPIPTQPTITDVVGCQCLVAGLVVGLVDADHPLADLPWAAAEASFYAAVEDGLGADLAWVTADGKRTDDPAVIFEEVFAYARRGLRAQGVDADVIDRDLGPLEARWDQRRTPSRWKIDRVRAALTDGADLAGALAAMQREYAALSREHDSFAEWPTVGE
ncbi:MAG: hypothetical protein ABEJ31_08430 [Haloarculaceae archaeon]